VCVCVLGVCVVCVCVCVWIRTDGRRTLVHAVVEILEGLSG